jgi:uncharacterized membrane protein
MSGNKFFMKSMTVWGILIMAAPQVAILLGIDFTAADAAEADGHVQTIITAIGGLLAVIGRVRAKQGLSVGSGP